MTTFDCQKCGACCQIFLVMLPQPYEAVRVEKALQKRHLPLLEVKEGSPVYMPREASGKCSAYKGDIGNGSCLIHEDKPNVCKNAVVGDRQCILSRIMAGIDTVQEPLKVIESLGMNVERLLEDWMRRLASSKADMKRLRSWKKKYQEQIKLEGRPLVQKLVDSEETRMLQREARFVADTYAFRGL